MTDEPIKKNKGSFAFHGAHCLIAMFSLWGILLLPFAYGTVTPDQPLVKAIRSMLSNFDRSEVVLAWIITSVVIWLALHARIFNVPAFIRWSVRRVKDRTAELTPEEFIKLK